MLNDIFECHLWILYSVKWWWWKYWQIYQSFTFESLLYVDALSSHHARLTCAYELFYWLATKELGYAFIANKYFLIYKECQITCFLLGSSLESVNVFHCQCFVLCGSNAFRAQTVQYPMINNKSCTTMCIKEKFLKAT